MKGSQSSTGLLHSVLTNGRRRWLLCAVWLATGVALVIFSPVCLFSAERGSPAPASAATLRADDQDEAQAKPVAQNEDEALEVGAALAQVDGDVPRSRPVQLAEALEPTPKAEPEREKPVDQPVEAAAAPVEAEVPVQPVEPQAPAQPQIPAQPVEVPQEEPAAPPVAPEEPPAPSCPSASMSGFALALFNAVNNERTQQGLPALATHGCVVYVAQLRSDDMASRGYFSHTSPEGETAFSLLDRYGVPHGWAGENLARNNYPDDQTVAVAIRDLMASEGHRANILSGNYTHLGVAVAFDGAGMKYFTMIFIGPP